VELAVGLFGGLDDDGVGSAPPRGVVFVGAAKGCELGMANPKVLIGLVRVHPPALGAEAPASGALSAIVASALSHPRTNAVAKMHNDKQGVFRPCDCSPRKAAKLSLPRDTSIDAIANPAFCASFPLFANVQRLLQVSCSAEPWFQLRSKGDTKAHEMWAPYTARARLSTCPLTSRMRNLEVFCGSLGARRLPMAKSERMPSAD
jgi:hypothetical protein